MSDAEQLRQKIARLQQRLLNPALDDDDREGLDLSLAKCLGQLAALTQSNVAVSNAPARDLVQNAGKSEMHGNSRKYGADVLNNLGHVWVNQTFVQPTASGKTTERLLDEYLDNVRLNANKLVLGTETQDTDQEKMSLANVWTMLRAEWTPRATDAQPADLLESLLLGASRAMPLREIQRIVSPVLQALGEEQHQHAVLLGVPGGGKTTVVSYLAAAQATAVQTKAKGAVLHDQGWAHTSLLPVRVRLKQVEPPDTPEYQTYHALWSVVSELNLTAHAEAYGMPKADTLEEQTRLRHAIEELLIAGKGLLLLDGLDEVPLERLAAVKGCINHALAVFGKSRIVISCRIHDYENPPPPPYPARQLVNLLTVRLQLFDLPAQQEYIRRYYTELGRHRPSNQDYVTIRHKHAKLHTELAKNGTLTELTRTPLLLALTVYVNMVRTELPEGEGELLYLCVDELLKRREPTGAGDRVPLVELHRLIALLAYHAHRQEEQDGDRFVGLDDTTIEALIKGYYQPSFSQSSQRKALDEATIRAKYRLLQSNGLLHESGNNAAVPSYDFPHRLFQQFLAGLYLLHDHFHQECVGLVTNNHWRISLNLMANYAPYPDRQSVVFSLVQTLLHGTPAQQIRGAELLVAMTAPHVRRSRPDLWQQATTTMQTLSVAPPPRPGLLGRLAGATRATLPERLAAGLALGALGDPRFVQPDDALIPITERLVELAAGTFDLENHQNQQRRISLPRFWIGRFPITNVEYREFIEAGGY